MTITDIEELNKDYLVEKIERLDEMTKKFQMAGARKGTFKLALKKAEEFFALKENKEELDFLTEMYYIFEDDFNKSFDQYIERNKDTNYPVVNFSMVHQVLRCWSSLLFLRDSRTVYEMAINVQKGHDVEDRIVKELQLLNCDVKLVGGDSDRSLSIMGFSTYPDLRVNGILVEVQKGTNRAFKDGKLTKCIENDARILYYHEDLKQYYLFNVQELIDIDNQQFEWLYKGKKGKRFVLEKYQFNTLEDSISELVDPFSS